MKKLILAVALLLGSLAFAKQHVDYNYYVVSLAYRVVVNAQMRCCELIEQGYTIVSVAFNANGYVIIYEDKEDNNE